MATMLSSCDGKSGLAQTIEGSWSSAPEQLANTSEGQSSVIENFVFTTDSTATGGAVQVMALISSAGSVNGPDAVMKPFSISVAANATISGTWQATGGDEIALNLNEKSLKVNVDPDMVQLVANPLSGNSTPSVDSLKPSMIAYFKQELQQTMAVRYASFRKLDDIKFQNQGAIMTLDVSDRHMTFTRQ